MISGNVAAGKAASAFSTVGRGIAARAVDGQDSAEEHVQHGSCYLPQRTWWPTPKFLTIDLGAIYDITSVTITTSDSMCYIMPFWCLEFDSKPFFLLMKACKTQRDVL
jgi:hypothetical protein